MSELKPCPFCGGEADLLDYGLTGARKVVQCSDCGARTRAFDPKVKRGENAIDAWNSRVCDDDCVSRQAAIDRINKQREHLQPDIYMQDKIGDAAYRICAEFIERLPSAQPERKKGKWIKKMRITETEKYTSYDPEWYCACCGTKYDSHVAKMVNFCYVCGDDMRGGENG